MRATSLAVLLLLSCSRAVLAAPVGSEDTGVGRRWRWRQGKRRRCRKRAVGGAALTRSGRLSRGADRIGYPPGSPLTPATVTLGEKLFFESRLSGDGTVACATCHDPARAFTDGRPASVGVHGRVGQRNAPTILNALYNKTQFWDGRVHTLEQQAALPITNPFEMGSASIGDAVSKIASDTNYQTQFMQAFGRGVNEQDMLRAIATYERTLVSFDSPFDHSLLETQTPSETRPNAVGNCSIPRPAATCAML